jgi:hypothetical protein
MEDWIADFAQMMEKMGMSNIGIAVKSGSFLRIVYGNSWRVRAISDLTMETE